MERTQFLIKLIANDGTAAQTVPVDIDSRTPAVKIPLRKPAVIQLETVNTGVAPNVIRVRRVKNDLHLLTEEGDLNNPDAIIEGFYDQAGSRVVGLAETTGQVHQYVPTNAAVSDYLPIAQEGASGYHVLGAEARATPLAWWTAPVAATSLLPLILGGATVAALAGGGGSGSTPSPVVDNTPPTITGFTTTTLDGSYKAGSVIALGVTLSEPAGVGQTFTVTLDTGDVITMTVAPGGLTATGNYTVLAGQASADLNIVSATAGNVTDIAGNGPLSIVFPSATLASTHAIVIDNIAPVVTPIPIVLDATGVAFGVDGAAQIAPRGTSGAYVVIWQGQDQNAQPFSTDVSVYVQNFSAAGVPIGTPTKLEAPDNTVGLNQQAQVTAIGADGAYVVAWRGAESAANGGDDSVFVQRFDSSGAATGLLKKLEGTNITAGKDQQVQVTEVGSAGDYVVAWRGGNASGGSFSIYLQKFAADGSELTTIQTFHATGNNSPFDYVPQVTALGTSGEFVLAFYGVDSGGVGGGGIGGDESVYIQKFGTDGLPKAGLPQVLLEATNNQLGLDFYPQVAAVGTSGAFAVCWYGQDVNASGDFSIYVQNFDASGAQIGVRTMLEASSNTVGGDTFAQITAVGGTSGAYVVAWHGQDAGATDTSIYVQNFNASGGTVGNPIKLEAPGNTTGNDQYVQIAALGSAGAYVVTWEGVDANGDSSIFVQRFDTTGTPVGTPLTLEATGNTAGSDIAAQVSAVGTAGAFVVTWSGQDPITSDYSVYVQNFAADGSPAYPVKSSEVGTGYLVHSSVTVSDLASITGAADNLWNSVAITAVNTPTLIATGGLLAGTYSLYSADAAGNLSLAAATTTKVTPIALDLNQDGVINYSHINLDVNGDGALDYTAWASAQDGVLVWDKYQDHTVHGNEQYAFAQYGGNTDLQGLAAAFDTNHDGLFNAADAQYAQFAVWQDANQNGIADAGEMQNLAHLGINAIHLVSDGVERRHNADVLEFGQGQAHMADGTAMLFADAQFAYTEEQIRIPLGYVVGA